MPTTIPMTSRHLNPVLDQGVTTQTSNLDFVVVAAFAVTGLLLSLAFASLFPLSADLAFLLTASVS